MQEWKVTATAFQTLNSGLKEYKYGPSPSDPNYMPGPNPMTTILEAKDVLSFEGQVLQMKFMPMPVLAVLCPLFR